MIIRTLFLFLFVFTTLNAGVVIKDGVKKYDDFSIEYFYDESSLYSVEDVSKIKFEKQISSQFTQGYKTATAWFKIEILNRSNKEDFILYFTEPFWTNVDLYTYLDGKWKVDKNGLNVDLNDRSINDNNPAFKLHITKDETITYFVKARTISGHIGEFQVYTADEYYRPSRISITDMYIILSFVFLVILIPNLYNLLVTRDRIYVYYLGYITSLIIFLSVKSGTYMSFGFHGWDTGLHTVGASLVLFLTLFSGRFLDLKNTMPLADKMFKLSSLIFGIFILLVSQDIQYANFVFNILSFLFLTLLLVVSVKSWLRGYSDAKYYLIALMIYTPAMGLMVLNFNTFLENNDITRYSFLAGSLIEIIFFTLLLTNKYLKTSTVNKLLIEQKRKLEHTKIELIREASEDSLTGLYNRRYFSKEAEKIYSESVSKNKNFSLLLMDLDKFKRINDTYGHSTGDKAIQATVQTIQDVLTKNDIAGRYGGEEFIVLLPDISLSDAVELAEEIRIKLQDYELVIDEDEIIKISISIGVAELEHKYDNTLESLIKRCDQALYRAKLNGRNCVYV
ncbi:sensor domain-containing diguanylate cyclase [Sulfurimonas sp.]|nr:sensor domain-containing diguanylate cyclase [Sulfurimonas sp.]